MASRTSGAASTNPSALAHHCWGPRDIPNFRPRLVFRSAKKQRPLKSEVWAEHMILSFWFVQGLLWASEVVSSSHWPKCLKLYLMKVSSASIFSIHWQLGHLGFLLQVLLLPLHPAGSLRLFQFDSSYIHAETFLFTAQLGRALSKISVFHPFLDARETV